MADRDDTDELLRRWHESERRSRERRAAPPRTGSKPRLFLCVTAVVAAGALVSGGNPIAPAGKRVARAARTEPAPVVKGVSARSETAIPSRAAMRRAWRFARRRGGQVSIAVVDTHGRLRGRASGRRYPSASVVKAMLLVAELRRSERDGQQLDGPTLDLLRAMITKSDNDSADVIYSRVGDAGLREVAAAAGMRRFSVALSWGYAQLTAADLARFFARLPQLVPPARRRFAFGLLRSLVAEHRWGLPRAAHGEWTVHAKGGWRETGSGQLVHQGAWLRDGRRQLAIAILTDGQPSRAYGMHTVRGVADRLLAVGH